MSGQTDAYSRPQDFAEVIERYKQGIAQPILLGDFLDAFYCSEKKQSFLDKEPPVYSAAPKSLYVLMAALAERLAHDWHLRVPAWTQNPRYHLRTSEASWGGLHNPSPRTKAALRAQTPVEFANRNYFVTANILERA